MTEPDVSRFVCEEDQIVIEEAGAMLTQPPELSFRERLTFALGDRSKYPGGLYPNEQEAAQGAGTGKKPSGEAEMAKLDAVYHYTGASGQPINKALRAGDISVLDEQLQKTISDLDQAMTPLPEAATLYRVMPHAVVADLAPGSTLTDAGFASTTWSKESAEASVLEHQAVGEGAVKAPVMVSVEVPAGMGHVDVNSVGLDPDPYVAEQEEVILPRNVIFEVVQNDAEGIRIRARLPEGKALAYRDKLALLLGDRSKYPDGLYPNEQEKANAAAAAPDAPPPEADWQAKARAEYQAKQDAYNSRPDVQRAERIASTTPATRFYGGDQRPAVTADELALYAVLPDQATDRETLALKEVVERYGTIGAELNALLRSPAGVETAAATAGRDTHSPGAQFVRAANGSPDLTTALKMMDHYVAEAPKFAGVDPQGKPAPLWRGLGLSKDAAAQLKVGTSIKDPGYGSSTSHQPLAKGFMARGQFTTSLFPEENEKRKGDVAVLMRIDGAQGKAAAMVGSAGRLSRQYGGDEFIWPRNTEFEVVSTRAYRNSLHVTVRPKAR